MPLPVTVGSTFIACACPEFVTVMITVIISSKTLAVSGETEIAAERLTGDCISMLPEKADAVLVTLLRISNPCADDVMVNVPGAAAL